MTERTLEQRISALEEQVTYLLNNQPRRQAYSEMASGVWPEATEKRRLQIEREAQDQVEIERAINREISGG